MYLYKYLPLERIDVLDNLMIRASPIRAFNDPFEMRPSFVVTPVESELEEEFEKAIRQKYEGLGIDERTGLDFESFRTKALPCRESWIQYFRSHAPAKYETKYVENLNKLCGVISLTRKRDSLLMWAHYADSHQGFVIEFDSANPFFNRTRNSKAKAGRLWKMKYTAARPQITLPIASEPDNIFIRFKSKEWRYEQEWRIVFNFSNADKVHNDKDEEIHLFNIPPEAIRSVICGSSMVDSDKGKIRNILRREQMAHITLLDAKLEKEHFGLQFIEVGRD